ncbi:DUF3805 domain-containing protein [Rhodocytophaga aerolata]|uniref:DUF3805 domain-containing protein n=1 Tax=Rhodocytophaga aerolata TaxID=455078 RepID=A0ABT8RHL4_9BACT|nr:DUF3805 domain-containing protein [Rhodocytophaga aerolata]MDO1451574.1 DUF3805 domain-containing protein [Rhodocytophaga aerolata]
MKIITLFISVLSLTSCIKQEKTFISNNKWCQLQYPANWSVIEEESGAYLFVDEDNWKGNFRVTPMRRDGQEIIDIQSSIEKEVNNNPGAKIVNLGQKPAAYYISQTDEGDGKMIIHNWLTGEKATLFICSFTVEAERNNDPELVEELEKCRKALATLKSL